MQGPASGILLSLITEREDSCLLGPQKTPPQVITGIRQRVPGEGVGVKQRLRGYQQGEGCVVQLLN